MNTKKCAISGAVAAILGTANMVVPASALAGIIPDGQYQIQIQTTATRIDSYGPGGTNFKITPPTGLESSFTFGKLPNAGSQGMTDNATLVSSSNRGSGIGGDGFAGVLDITVVGDAITVQTFSIDTIFITAGGSFAQHLENALNPLMSIDPLPAPTTNNMTGTVDASGNLELTLTGRMGTIDGPEPDIIDRRWNVDAREAPTVVISPTLSIPPASASWNVMTTGASRDASAITGSVKGITGVPLVNAGDLNGDGFADFSGTLVGGGDVGSDWITFKGAAYFEVWKINIMSVSVTVNLPPTVSPTAVQNGTAIASIISNNVMDGTVVTSANAADPENGTITYAWTVTSPANCATVVGGILNAATVEIDPVSCVIGDSVTAAIAVTDDGTPSESANASVTYTVASTLVSDIDQDGIPDSVDRSPNDASVLQLSLVPAQGEAQVSAGNTITLGSTALCSTSDGILVTATEISTVGGDGCVAPASSAPDSLTNVGGYFDFDVRVTNPGDTASVVIPLTTAIPANATYRKFRQATGWSDFLAVGSDVFASATGAPGICPGVGDAAYAANTNDLVQGHLCVQLTITDGGPNDADGSANGVITDPGGVAGVVLASAPTGKNKEQETFENNGSCTINPNQPPLSSRFDWILLAGFIVWIGSISLRRKRTIK